MIMRYATFATSTAKSNCANYNVDVQSSGVTNASSEIDDEKINKVADVVNNELSGELPKLSISSESKAESASSERVLTTGDGLYYGTKLKYTCVTPDDSDRVWTSGIPS